MYSQFMMHGQKNIKPVTCPCPEPEQSTPRPYH